MKPVATPTHAVGYVRGSTEEQQNTLTAQRTQIIHYCGLKQYLLGECFIDEGESACHVNFFDRPTVQAMLAWMKDHQATDIIITKLDRGFRDAVDMLQTVRQLAEHGIRVHLLDIGLDPSTAIGEAVATFLAAIARFECRRRGERQQDAFAVMRIQKQRTGAVSYGWDTVTSTRKSKTGRDAENLIVNVEEMKWLMVILTWSKDGMTDCEIARRLNTAGVKTKNAGKPMQRKGQSWICDGQWAAASVLSVRRHALLPDEDQQASLSAQAALLAA